MDAVYLVFWAFALITCGSAVVVTLSPRLIHSVFALFFCLFGVAGLYVILGADFLAATQVILYIGGIVVLLIFGVMLTNRFAGHGQVPNSLSHWPAGALVAAGVFALLMMAGAKMQKYEAELASKDSRESAWSRSYDQVAPVDPKTGARRLPLFRQASPDRPDEPAPAAGTTLPIGQALMTTYLLPFELASVVLLVAMIGAASIARKEIR